MPKPHQSFLKFPPIFTSENKTTPAQRIIPKSISLGIVKNVNLHSLPIWVLWCSHDNDAFSVTGHSRSDVSECQLLSLR